MKDPSRRPANAVRLQLHALAYNLGNCRYVAFQMAEVAIPRILFANILRLV